MALANNDYNWRLIAAVDLDANIPLCVDGDGKAAIASNETLAEAAVGFSMQAVKAGDRVGVFRGGKLGELSGLTAGDIIYLGVDGALLTVEPTGGGEYIQRLGYVPFEDATTMLIDIQPAQAVLESR